MSSVPTRVITVIRSGKEMMVLFDGKPLSVLISSVEKVDLNVEPGERPPSIRVTIPAERVEVIDAMLATRMDGHIRQQSKQALGAASGFMHD